VGVNSLFISSNFPVIEVGVSNRQQGQARPQVTQVLNSMEVPANKTDILKLFDKMNKDIPWTILDPSWNSTHRSINLSTSWNLVLHDI
jgi:hypothetical protein